MKKNREPNEEERGLAQDVINEASGCCTIDRELENVIATSLAKYGDYRERNVAAYFQQKIAMLLSGHGQLYLDGLAIFEPALKEAR